jgi:hypothetical protein
MSSTFDNADYPAYTMGRAADMIGVTPAFLRSLGAAGLIEPERSTGGHRRYFASPAPARRARPPTARRGHPGSPRPAASSPLEDRLAAAHRRIIELGGVLTATDDVNRPTPTAPPA